MRGERGRATHTHGRKPLRSVIGTQGLLWAGVPEMTKAQPLEPHSLHEPLLVLDLLSQRSLLPLVIEFLKGRTRDTHMCWRSVLSQTQGGRRLCSNMSFRASATLQKLEEPQVLGSMSAQ